MEKEKLEIVLEDLLEEQKALTVTVQDLNQHFWQLEEKITGLEKKLEAIKLVAPPVDTGPVQGVVRIGFAQVQQLMAEQPKTVVHERRFLLFPEHHATEYYRILFRVILWLTVASAVYYLFALGKQALQNHKEVSLRELELAYAQKAFLVSTGNGT
jgi:hypothetical protein